MSSAIQNKDRSRAQSAMEYLMTYGWSILLIAIVIAAIFELGVFNGNPLSSSNTCLAQSGFLCAKPVLNSTGILNITFGQSYGTTYTIIGVACTNSSNSPSSFIPVSPIIVYTGSSSRINFNCPISSGVIGTPFAGSLWIQYTTTRLNSQTVKIATVNLKVVTTSAQGGSGLGAQNLYPSLQSVPISLINLQSSSTGSNFQQMLVINSNLYSSYISSTWSNVEFTTGNIAAGNVGTVLQAWIESNATNTATHTIVWINLPSGIPATSSTTIYMNILNGNVISSSGPTGEAPQLSSAYGKYDNGASVFYQYDNFKGNVLNSNWNSAGTVVVSNGLTMSVINSFVAWDTAYNPQTYVTDFYGYFTAYAGSQFGLFVNNGRTGSPQLQVTTGQGCTSSVYLIFIYSGVLNCGATIGALSTSSPNVFSLWASASAFWAGANYGSIVSQTTGYSVINPAYATTTVGSSGQVVATWFRVRLLPPGNTMPTQNIGVAAPSGIIHYVPITLTNLQGTATQNNFQTNMVFNAGAYQAYEQNSLTNIEFFYANGTVVPSWMEGNWLNELQTTSLYASNSIMYWLNIAPQISASGGTLTVYLGFAANTINLLSAGTTGEAPQLSSSYGQYDDGASVFSGFYQNFAGSSLPSGWTSYGTAPTSANELVFSGSGGSSFDTNAKYPINSILDYLIINTPSGANAGGAYSVDSSGNQYTSASWFSHGGSGNVYNGIVFQSSTAALEFYSYLAGTQNNFYNPSHINNVVVGLASDGTNDYGYYNYGLQTSSTAGTVPPVGNYYIVFGTNNGVVFQVQWVRTRSLPPNGVLPSVSFGSFT